MKKIRAKFRNKTFEFTDLIPVEIVGWKKHNIMKSTEKIEWDVKNF
jgi:hypothetical protein